MLNWLNEGDEEMFNLMCINYSTRKLNVKKVNNFLIHIYALMLKIENLFCLNIIQDIINERPTKISSKHITNFKKIFKCKLSE